MKLLSWNVNGLRSTARNGFLAWLEDERPDVVCLQETRVLPEELPAELRNPLGYHACWHPARKKGYSGVATFSKRRPLAVRQGIGNRAIDREGRVLATEFPRFVLINAYFPATQRDHARLDFKLSFCRSMLRMMNRYRREGRAVVVCGDYNIAHTEIDLANPKGNRRNAGFLPEERAWMDRVVKHGWVDTFRHFQSEPGHYSWWSNLPGVRARNVGWRIDYFYASPDLEPELRAAYIQKDVMGSDHCPIGLELAGRG